MGQEQERNQSIRSREILDYERIAVGLFKEKYHLFKRLRSDKITLFKADFLPMPAAYSYDLYSALEVTLPEDSSLGTIGAKYSNPRNAFLKVFEKDRLSDDYNTGLSKGKPLIHTRGLRRFLNNNSTEEVDIIYQVYGLIGEDKRMITVMRFCNPVTLEPISEVWIATSINQENSPRSESYNRILSRLPAPTPRSFTGGKDPGIIK